MDFETPPPPENEPESPSETPPPDEERPRRGRARERYERRRGQAKPSSGRGSTPRQIRPPQQFTMPKIIIPRNSRALLSLVGAVLFVIFVIIVLGRLRNDAPEVLPNAMWIGTEWTYDDPTDEQVAAFAERLRAHHIGTVYAWVSWLQLDGTWRGTAEFESVKTFVNQFNAVYPEADLYGWVSLPTETALGSGVTRIDDPALRQTYADFTKQVVEEFGFDGIFINAEPVWDGDSNFIELLRAVRAAVGIDVPISAAIPPDWSPTNSSIPLPPLITPGTEWAKEYKQSVALLVNHMAVMAYHSGLNSTSDYAQWVAYQVATFAEAIAELNTDIDVIIGIPTFSDEPPGHLAAVENVTSAVEGVRLGLEQAGDAANYVRGLAIYVEWETDATEWAAFMAQWVEPS